MAIVWRSRALRPQTLPSQHSLLEPYPDWSLPFRERAAWGHSVQHLHVPLKELSLEGNTKRLAVSFFSVLLLIASCVGKTNDNNPSTSGVPVTVFGPKGFQRTTGQPNVFQETFPAASGTGLLQLFNGGSSSGSQVTSAWVVLNGKQILGPDDFKKGGPLFSSSPHASSAKHPADHACE